MEDVNWVVTKVPLLARGDGRPRSRDFAAIGDVIEEDEGLEDEARDGEREGGNGDEGMGREKERERVMCVRNGAGGVPVSVPVLERLAIV